MLNLQKGFSLLAALLFFFSSYAIAEETQPLSLSEKTYRLGELEDQIHSIEKWQAQYLKKAKSFHLKAGRVQFKNTTDTKRYRKLADEAYNNAQSLQAQIVELNNKKQELLH